MPDKDYQRAARCTLVAQYVVGLVEEVVVAMKVAMLEKFLQLQTHPI